MMDDLLGVLEEFLGSEQAPKTALSILALDGYLTAVAIGPELVRPSEWLPQVWGSDAPVFDSVEQAQTVLSAIMMRYNEILRQIDKTPKRYRPLYLPSAPSTEPASAVRASEWARGFWRAMTLRSPNWSFLAQDEDARLLLAPIVCFIKTDEGHPLLRGDPDELDGILLDAAEIIPEAVIGIRDYWKKHDQSGNVPVRTPRAARPGRNDPCPCGSGIKYKRCCGLN